MPVSLGRQPCQYSSPSLPGEGAGNTSSSRRVVEAENEHILNSNSLRKLLCSSQSRQNQKLKGA